MQLFENMYHAGAHQLAGGRLRHRSSGAQPFAVHFNGPAKVTFLPAPSAHTLCPHPLPTPLCPPPSARPFCPPPLSTPLSTPFVHPLVYPHCLPLLSTPLHTPLPILVTFVCTSVYPTTRSTQGDL